MYKIAIFVSGRGSNLKAVLDARIDGVATVLIVADKQDCKALEIAAANNIETVLVSFGEKPGYITFSDLISKLKDLRTDLIVLAGFLKKIPDFFIDAFEDGIINIHPALLPSFGGKGMYGMNVHKAVFESSAKVSGPTVHFVDKIFDNGKIIAQKAVDISDVNSPEEIASLVLKEEHILLPYVIECFYKNRIKIVNNRVIINKEDIS